MYFYNADIVSAQIEEHSGLFSLPTLSCGSEIVNCAISLLNFTISHIFVWFY